MKGNSFKFHDYHSKPLSPLTQRELYTTQDHNNLLLSQSQSTKSIRHVLSFSSSKNIKQLLLKKTSTQRSSLNGNITESTEISPKQITPQRKISDLLRYIKTTRNPTKVNAICYSDRKEIRKVEDIKSNIKNKISNIINGQKSTEAKRVLSRKVFKYTYGGLFEKNLYYYLPKNVTLGSAQNVLNSIDISHNKIKGFTSTKHGNLYQTNKNSTVMYKKSAQKSNILKRLLVEKDISQNLFKAIKWKIMWWLWNFKAFIVEKLIYSYKDYKWFFEKESKITYRVIEEFISLLKIPKDTEFVDIIFLLFKNKEDNSINYIEMLLTLILVSEKNFETKIDLVMEFMGDGKTLKLDGVVDIFSHLIGQKELKYLTELIKRKVPMKDEEMEYELFENFLKTNEKIKRLFSKYWMTSDEIERNLENELGIQCNANMRNSQTTLAILGTKIFVPNDFKKFLYIIETVTKCSIKKGKLLKYRSRSSEDIFLH